MILFLHMQKEITQTDMFSHEAAYSFLHFMGSFMRKKKFEPRGALMNFTLRIFHKVKNSYQFLTARLQIGTEMSDA